MTYIVDEAWERPTPDELIAAGYSGLMGYISQDTTGKNITRAEIDAYHAKGLDVGLNYEYNPGSAKGGASAGNLDGDIAVTHARGIGAPAGTCLYFSVDWDVTEAQKPAVLAYANAARDKCLAAGYEAGIYGGYWVVLYLLANGYKGRLWQTYAWSGGNWLANAVLRQVYNGIIVGGKNVDKDEVMNPEWGQWKSGATTPPVEVDWGAAIVQTLPEVRRGNTGRFVRKVQSLANCFGAGLSEDGNFGPNTEAAIRHIQSNYGIGVDGVVGPVTWRVLLTR